MRKILPIIIVGILILSGAGVISVQNVQKNEYDNEILLVKFDDQININKENDYLEISFEGTNSKLAEPNNLMLPIYIETFEFSSNAKIKEVKCEFSNIKEKIIFGKIAPCPEIVPYSKISKINKKPEIIENKDIYGIEALFPNSWYEYHIRCGLNSRGISTTFVTVEIHPVRYAPTQNMLYYLKDAEIKIEYKDPGNNLPTTNSQSYDLVIIAPSEFTTDLQPLIVHKNSYNIDTILKTTEEIYSEYEGRDKPEQIKYFIKDALENWNITYVLLVGGLKKYFYAKDKDDTNQGSSAWHLPIRYAHIQHSDEKSCISDLYYGDIYRYNEETDEREFEDWDSNGDDIFAKWTMLVRDKDTLDLVPDVYVGRLACRNKVEVRVMVNKIIQYESTSPDEKPWYKKMIGIGGRTFDLEEGQPDGEFACDVAIGYMEDVIDQEIRVYASNKDTSDPTIPEDIIPTISEGAGYVLFQGHGNPTNWNTHPVNNPDEWIGPATMVYDFPKFSNKGKLPVILVGGCHNGLFKLTILQIILNSEEYWTDYPSPFCFSWGLCILPQGGAIASTGCTGYGFSNPGPINHSGALETGFFYQIGKNGAQNLGDAHSGTIRDFILKERIRADEAFRITIWELFGDPSLKLGGYPSN
jgi:hypothetical protein